MQEVDLYICTAAQSERFRFIRVFDKNFYYEADKIYVGFLGINVNRIKLISVISDLRAHRIDCFGVPVEYRDRENISMSRALDFAKIHANGIGASVLEEAQPPSKCPPVYWKFSLISKNSTEEKAGGLVMVDRIDGHVWTDAENEEYMYDYNNVF